MQCSQTRSVDNACVQQACMALFDDLFVQKFTLHKLFEQVILCITVQLLCATIF